MKNLYNTVCLTGALVLGVIGAQTALAADVLVVTPEHNANGEQRYFDNNYNWGDKRSWRCIASGRDGRFYRDYGSTLDRARNHALNYCANHTRNCSTEHCERI